jgi:hypothetical protein
VMCRVVSRRGRREGDREGVYLQSQTFEVIPKEGFI